MTNTDDTFTYKIGIKNPVYTIISECDKELITGHLSYVFQKYAYMELAHGGRSSLQTVIMGQRPSDVPENWVIDHKNRNKLDNTRGNLRWVSKSFNSWNCVRTDPRTLTSRFKGVSKKEKPGPQWRARGTNGVHLGFFYTEREAAIAAATAYVQVFGNWAVTSDLLVSEDQSLPGALLSPEDMRVIVLSLATEQPADESSTAQIKEKGVSKTQSGKFRVVYKKKYMGVFDDFESAVAFRRAHVAAVREQEWQDHLLLEPDRDDDGDVAIALTGEHGKGHMSKVDPCHWHELTFKNTFSMNQQGYARSTRTMLHTAVMLLIDPKYVPSRDASIDHIDPEAKLDNRASNLRVRTNLEQQRNKTKRAGASSSHLGVSASKGRWEGCFSYTTSEGPQRYRVWCKTEEDATLLLNAKRIEIHGETAVLGP